MKTIGNLLWFLLGGLIMSGLWFLVGAFLCLTIVGIPFGMQCFKVAGFVLWPFGRDIEPGRFGVMGLLGNLLWILFLGWELCLLHLFWGVLLCLTIVGIPFGLQHFKLALLAFVPFGARIH